FAELAFGNPQNFPQESAQGRPLGSPLRAKTAAYFLVAGAWVAGVVRRGVDAAGLGAEGTGAATPEEALYAVIIACEISVPGAAHMTDTPPCWPLMSRRSV